MKASELKDRTKKFAVAIMKLVDALPEGRSGATVADPLIRCGTAVGSTYRLTCKARNSYDFMARIGAVEEAADETIYWLEVILETNLLKAEKVQPLLEESRVLSKIFRKSRKAAVRRHRRNPSSGFGGGMDEDIPF